MVGAGQVLPCVAIPSGDDPSFTDEYSGDRDDDVIVDGRKPTFGVSGKLANDDPVIYDRETDSEWKQSGGERLDGEFGGRTPPACPAR